MNERKARENHKVPFIYYVSPGMVGWVQKMFGLFLTEEA